ncbi:hypothetical protein MHUMG1_10138 [Metarhizium humberi]|uniref:Uncharacterized protein n=1 Tax=Metarhizium humberi TaxID=2596975 RepID=A0A9P8M4T5_9HYPO|nr:hypothetical protein MHUMG1_10138 [Metarhizium humberi]
MSSPDTMDFLPDGGNQRHLFFWTCHFIIWANIIYSDGGGRGRARDSGLVRAGDAQGRDWDEAEGLDGIAAISGKAADQLARWLCRPPYKGDPDGDSKDKDDNLSWHIGSSLDSHLMPNINADGLGLGDTINGPQHEVGGCELGPKTADERYGCLRDGHLPYLNGLTGLQRLCARQGLAERLAFDFVAHGKNPLPQPKVQKLS